MYARGRNNVAKMYERCQMTWPKCTNEAKTISLQCKNVARNNVAKKQNKCMNMAEKYRGPKTRKSVTKMQDWPKQCFQKMYECGPITSGLN